MIRILLCGCCGKMGRTVLSGIKSRDNLEVTAGVDIAEDASLGFPVFQSYAEVNVKADVIIDFSHPTLLPGTLKYAKDNNIPAVIATTGLSEADTESIKAASKKVPIFFTYNMSVGVSLLCELSKTAAKVLGDSFDIEIVEAHHNQKLDAPSGTAVMIADSINKELSDEHFYRYDRHSIREKRDKKEIGMHSIRGGTIVGEHEVIFAGNDEIVKISHSARSKAIFATGALNAAAYIVTQKSGLYGMADLIAD